MTDEQEKPHVDVGDGNAFLIIGRAKKAARKAGWSQDKIDAVVKEMKDGDYDHLLQTGMRYFDLD